MVSGWSNSLRDPILHTGGDLASFWPCPVHGHCKCLQKSSHTSGRHYLWGRCEASSSRWEDQKSISWCSISDGPFGSLAHLLSLEPPSNRLSRTSSALEASNNDEFKPPVEQNQQNGGLTVSHNKGRRVSFGIIFTLRPAQWNSFRVHKNDERVIGARGERGRRLRGWHRERIHEPEESLCRLARLQMEICDYQHVKNIVMNKLFLFFLVELIGTCRC